MASEQQKPKTPEVEDKAPKPTIPGTENLNSFADKRVFLWLRDGRKLFGVLRSFDQFGNITLSDTYERFYASLEFAESYHGVYLVRGENIVVVGDFEPREFEALQRRMTKFRRPIEYILPMVQEQMEEIATKRRELGAMSEFAENDLY
jgi:U6 snRNA-associated Sm-like protein LSm1